ncbi:aldose epimerase family protein [Boseongicola aestuarii]|uniref:Aldose 1-epimerase n=1 Tax=Boseongicola aestuarii TaxID=1470561 RepID=A0A238IZT1_9RHOB|nr:hypothetical protein [Boseongicola aestuarii]SMX23395.1 Aldose 1-epimerase precursor [Boseongicola aestuarii]
MNTREFGVLSDGRSVREVTIANEHLTARFLTLGARINGLIFDGIDGLTPALSLAKAEARPFCGTIVGPVMNRLANASAVLDEQTLSFPANEGANLLHSGALGLHRMVWDIAAADESSVTFCVDLPPDAFPGQRRVLVSYRLKEADLVLDITATTDAPTLMNVGFHPFWALSGQGRDGHTLQIYADHVLAMDAANIPTGDIAQVDGTALDYRKARGPSHSVDHCFVLPRTTKLQPCVTLESGNLRLEILSDAPAVHVYTGMDYGIAVEPEIHPDAPNQPNFPSIRLDPSNVFRQTTVHRFSKR